jgi:transposase
LPLTSRSGEVDRIPHDEASVRRLVARLGGPRRLRACYEAGPTGFDLARLLERMGVGCQVVASVADPHRPRGSGQDRYAGLPPAHRGCTAPASWSPSASRPSTRKPSGTCAAPAPTRSPTAPARGTGCREFLLRHGRVWRGGASAWTHAHERWLLAQRFDEPALAATYAHYRAVLLGRDAQLDAIEADLAGWYDRPPFAAQVARLAAYRGVTRLGALTLAAEVARLAPLCSGQPVHGVLRAGAQRVPGRPADLARTADQGRQRAPARAAGPGRPGPTSTAPRWAPRSPAASRAWTPSHRACVGGAAPVVRPLCAGSPARKTSKNLVVAAIARELAGFLWAEMTA